MYDRKLRFRSNQEDAALWMRKMAAGFVRSDMEGETVKKGQIRTGIAEAVKFPNKAVVRLLPEEIKTEEVLEAAAAAEETPKECGQEEICTVKGALPGQKISLVVTKVRKGKGEGRLKEILEPSPLETALGGPDCCRHFGICGGCSYLSMPYEESLRIKEGQVRDLLGPVLEKTGEGMRFRAHQAQSGPVRLSQQDGVFFRGRGEGRPSGAGNAQKRKFL